MKKLILAIFGLFTFLQFSFTQPNVELKIIYSEAGCGGFNCFQVYMRPTVPYTNPVNIGASQVTVLLPTTINSSGQYFFFLQGAGGTWGIVQNNIACDANFCYHAIATSGSPYNSDIAAGEEVHLFSFVLTSPNNICLDGVRLHNTGSDPQDPGGTGADFDINVFIDGEVYLGNYDNDPIDCMALPVNFIAFEAQKVGLKKAKLDWATASEEGNDYFAVQRGRDPYSWETIGVVPGAGHSARRNDYNFYDNNPYIGRNYYRIIQVDFDGSEKGTNIRELSFTDAPEQGEIEIYPNPSSRGLHVQFPTQALEMPTVMTIYDNTGRIIFSRDLSEGTDYEYIDYTKTNITTGAYILQIGNADTVIDRQKVIVQRTQ